MATTEENNLTEHPLELVANNFETYKNSEEFLEEKKLCVLLSTGSLNPVHLGHVQAFTSAKEILEEKHHFKVLAGFISPSDKGWCSHKPYGCFSNNFRLDLVKLATDEHDWIQADGWEINQGMVDYPEVCGDLIGKLNTTYGDNKIQVLYLCGADHATKCGLWGGSRRSFGVCVMKRPGYPEKKPGKNVFVCDVNEFDASSTEIRQAFVQNNLESVKQKLNEKVLGALQKTNEKLKNY